VVPVFVATLGVAIAGCAQSGYDASKLQRELRQAGVTPAQAACVTDAFENDFDINQLASHSDPTADQEAETRATLAKCGVKLPAK
jgi:hypothetical protein